MLDKMSVKYVPTEEDKECPVCYLEVDFKDPENQMEFCGHVLCKSCQQKLKKPRCPVCRQPESANEDESDDEYVSEERDEYYDQEYHPRNFPDANREPEDERRQQAINLLNDHQMERVLFVHVIFFFAKFKN